MKNSELLELQTYADTQDKSPSTSNNETLWWNVENSPFVVLKKKDKYVIGMGGQLVSNKTFETILKAEDYIREKPWELITVACLILIDHVNNKNEEK